jgi:DNA ligase D-like protein (predicted polymerase)/DNA ligase D-like protein (predicted 3'-phosphoesterase)
MSPAKTSAHELLTDYRKKRNFRQTPEPSTAKRRSPRKGAAPHFVVQMHRASHLHFDFRLEADGTLKSWAVPKGPSMNTADKRLAMQVEDHPVDYAGFEGQIPKGNYGAGEVIVWDAGTYELLEGEDPAREIARGSLKFLLHGKKLRGAFALVKMRGRDGQENAWLLIKERDKYATSDKDSRRDDRSVLTKRTLDDIAENPRARKWHSNRSKEEPAPREDDEAVEITRPDKVLFPDDGYTKADLAKYYDAVARWMLPHLKDRPLSLERYPDGIGGPSFFEKNIPRGAPSWVRTASIAGGEKRDVVRYVLGNDRRTLKYLANLAAITLHVWTSRVESLDEPDFVFFDLDPGDRCPLARLARVALQLRDLLKAIGLRTLVKTSGGRGLHVLVPLRAGYEYPLVRAFGELVARQLADVAPSDVTLERSTTKRRPAVVYFDYVQIGRGKTMVAPFSVRARAGAPVSMPVTWGAIEKMRSSRARSAEKAFLAWTIATVPRLLTRGGDPWKGAFNRGQGLERAVKLARSKWG